ncbi:MAG: hypothetical protein E7589_03210 [Ruminococcaceae bacterium]|nr:hypothetical protein [Oscillospiraceae bacterium]
MAGGRSAFSRNADVYAARIKAIIFGVIFACALCAMESTRLSSIRLPLLGYSSPMLCLGMSVAVGFLMGESEGGVAGLFSGFLCECAEGDGIFIFPLLYFALGYLTGLLTDRILGKNLASYLVFLAVAALVSFGADTLLTAIVAGGFYENALLSLVAGIVLTVVFSIPIYLLVRLYAKASNKQ